MISKKAVKEFSETYPDALEALLHWFDVTKRANRSNLADTRQDFGHADQVERFTVFNIKGNKYRLIASINYQWKVVFVRHILTHSEYSKGKWKV